MKELETARTCSECGKLGWCLFTEYQRFICRACRANLDAYYDWLRR